MSGFYHEEQRRLQAAMATTRIANRLEETRRRDSLIDTDHEIIGAASFFFLSSMTPEGRVDGSIKCGPEGFVHILGPGRLGFPDYDGNGMFRSLGNIRATSEVALLFAEFWGAKRKLRILGRASVEDDPAIVGEFVGAQLAVMIDVTDVFSNCPRYLPDLEPRRSSEYVDALGREALEPLWKSKPDLIDFVHERRSK